ncbi:diguanylate cyclase [Pelomonas sp. CA6]|uniref:GGDEF domain-containing protein n=1 Tax=Pelomonas sp. CA6 TaxID=2907999 RepID=UPI001F4BCD2D|nr:diguanylate cyclase [Pelomonas sp. CA6]MCH7342670.1 diguanylate cyclase [Pelomonas sp. CA6]
MSTTPDTDDTLHQSLAQARSARRDGRMDEGLALAAQVWSEAQRRGFVAEQTEAGHLCAHFRYRRGDHAGLLEVGQALLPLLRQQSDLAMLAEVLRWMALSSAELSQFDQALAYAHEAVLLAEDPDDLRTRALALNALGACFERMGDPWQAERLMNEAAALIREIATPQEVFVSLNNLCHVALGMRQLLADGEDADGAAQALARALHYAEELQPQLAVLSDPFCLALHESHLAEIRLLRGEADAALAHLQTALRLCDSQGYAALGARIHALWAELDLLRGDAAAAWDRLQTLEALGGQVTLAEPLRLRLHRLGWRCARELGHTAAALAHVEQLRRFERRRGQAQLQAQSRYFLDRLEAEQCCSRGAGASASADEDGTLGDPLTGLGSRRLLEARLPSLLRSAEQGGRPATLALIDADGLSRINEAHGRQAGDAVLQRLAELLRDNTRGSDLLLRWGGEEFLVVLVDTVADRAVEVLERLNASVAEADWSDIAPGLSPTFSVGLASTPPYSMPLLLARAEAAMFRAKHLGGNRVALA